MSLLDETQKAVASWQIVNAWPTKYTAPDFNATSNEIAIEALELFEASECQKGGRKYSLFEIVTILSLAGRMTGAAIVVKGPVDSKAHKYAPYLLKLLDQEGMEHGKANSLGPWAVLVDSAFQ